MSVCPLFYRTWPYQSSTKIEQTGTPPIQRECQIKAWVREPIEGGWFPLGGWVRHNKGGQPVGDSLTLAWLIQLCIKITKGTMSLVSHNKIVHNIA